MDGGSAANAGAILRPTAMDGGSAANAGAILRPTAMDGGSAANAGAICGRRRARAISSRAGRRALVGTRAAQDVEHREIALVARVLEHAVAVVAPQRKLHRPGRG